MIKRKGRPEPEPPSPLAELKRLNAEHRRIEGLTADAGREIGNLDRREQELRAEYVDAHRRQALGEDGKSVEAIEDELAAIPDRRDRAELAKQGAEGAKGILHRQIHVHRYECRDAFQAEAEEASQEALKARDEAMEALRRAEGVEQRARELWGELGASLRYVGAEDIGHVGSSPLFERLPQMEKALTESPVIRPSHLVARESRARQAAELGHELAEPIIEAA
jgi:hypothetical protein